MALGGGFSIDNMRIPADAGEPLPDPADILLDDEPEIDPKIASSIELPDGGVIIRIGEPKVAKKDTKFGDNLALSLDDSTLGMICEDLLLRIDQDEQSRSEWIQTRAKGIELLGLKIEAMRSSGGAEGSAPLEGMSQIRNTLLLEAVVRFAANAFAELCPADGPAKVGEDNTDTSMLEDDLADALGKGLNHYLTFTDKPWVPDTDGMIMRIGVDGCAFKKVYYDPILRRPVSRSVNAEDLIVNNNATSLYDATRVTQHIRMPRSTLRRMQILNVYRDVELQDPIADSPNAVEMQTDRIAGIEKQQSTEPEDKNYDIFECYCELDIKGFEHETDGEEDGLAIPYKVVIEKDSRQILEIRRNYDEDDELCLPKTYFVQFPFIRGFGFYAIGLSHLLGNITSGLTAVWREFVDLGMLTNFPGFLIQKGATRQDSSVIRIPPGGSFPVETGGAPIQNVAMPLPYPQMSPVFVQFAQYIEQVGQRLGGTADVMVGEGRQDMPVGTALALIEQAIKPLLATHKRLCAAQADELQLLVERFREDPPSFWKLNKTQKRYWSEEKFLQALDDYNIVPRADPNTASHLQRMMRNAALYQMAKDDATAGGQAFNLQNVRETCIRGLGFGNPQEFLNPPQPTGQAQPDPKEIAAQASAQADLLDSQTKAKKLALDAQNSQTDLVHDAQERQSKEKIAEMQLTREQMISDNKIKGEAFSHALSLHSDHLQQQANHAHEFRLRQHDQAHDRGMEQLRAALQPPPQKPAGPE